MVGDGLITLHGEDWHRHQKLCRIWTEPPKTNPKPTPPLGELLTLYHHASTVKAAPQHAEEMEIERDQPWTESELDE